MRAKLILPAIAAGLVVLAGCDIEDLGGFERYHEDFHYSYPLKAGGRLSVEGFIGSVEVSVWDQETVDISGTKYARTQEDTHDLKIEVDHSADSVSVRAVLGLGLQVVGVLLRTGVLGAADVDRLLVPYRDLHRAVEALH